MRFKKVWIAVGGVLAAGAVAGVAWAVWTATGGGTAAGKALTAQVMTVNAVTPGSPGASLYPGGPAGWVYFSVTNPNPYSVNVTHLSWGTPVSTDTADCPSANFSIDASAPTAVNLPVPANGTSGAFQVFNVIDLAHAAPDGCQGVAVNIPLSVSGTQT